MPFFHILPVFPNKNSAAQIIHRLCINAGRLGVEYSTDIILEYINRLKK